MKNSTITELEDRARELRKKIVSYSNYAKIPHLGSCLSIVEILTILYFHQAKNNPKNPTDENRDRIVLSKGHGAPALFQTLAMSGYFPESWMFRNDHGGGLFGEHPPAPAHLAGIEAATGSLGHGFPMALGMALSAKVQKKNYHCFAVLGDGECNEGSIWEAAMFAAGHCVDNLTAIVDKNKWQATGRSDDILHLSPLDAKFEAFGFETFVVDGHNFKQLSDALTASVQSSRPCAIVANTVKGKGISFMEDDNNWHYRIPNDEELVQALEELN